MSFAIHKVGMGGGGLSMMTVGIEHSSGSGGSFSFDYPAGMQAGDLIFLVCQARANDSGGSANSNSNTPSGYTSHAIVSDNDGGGPSYYVHGRLCTKIADGGEGSTGTFTYSYSTLDGGGSVTVFVVRIVGETVASRAWNSVSVGQNAINNLNVTSGSGTPPLIVCAALSYDLTQSFSFDGDGTTDPIALLFQAETAADVTFNSTGDPTTYNGAYDEFAIGYFEITLD